MATHPIETYCKTKDERDVECLNDSSCGFTDVEKGADMAALSVMCDWFIQINNALFEIIGKHRGKQQRKTTNPVPFFMRPTVGNGVEIILMR